MDNEAKPPRKMIQKPYQFFKSEHVNVDFGNRVYPYYVMFWNHFVLFIYKKSKIFEKFGVFLTNLAFGEEVSMEIRLSWNTIRMEIKIYDKQQLLTFKKTSSQFAKHQDIMGLFKNTESLFIPR